MKIWFTYNFDSFDKPIMISIWVIFNGFFLLKSSSISIIDISLRNNLLPLHLLSINIRSRSKIFDCFIFERISSFNVQFIRSMLIQISVFFDLKLFIYIYIKFYSQFFIIFINNNSINQTISLTIFSICIYFN